MTALACVGTSPGVLLMAALTLALGPRLAQASVPDATLPADAMAQPAPLNPPPTLTTAGGAAWAEATLSWARASPSESATAEVLWDVALTLLERHVDPGSALDLFEVLEADFEHTPFAERATAKRQLLSSLGTREDPAAVKVYLSLPDEVAELRGFLVNHLDFPTVGRARVQLRLARLEPELSLDVPLPAEERWRSDRVELERLLADGEWSTASALAERAGDTSLARTTTLLATAGRLSWLCMVLVGLTVIIGAARAARAGTLRRAPPVVRYFAPVAAVLLAAAHPMEAHFRPAMFMLAFGATALLWVLAVQQSPAPGLRRAMLHALVLAAFFFAVVERQNLLVPLVTTVREGLQR
ncbi:MAG: hypothetical protein EXR76_13985 [Myxococcales bacterium]|nr:hypothetical protein [Myxococcales bacterium]